MATDSPFFIVGAQRSGTTLLREILAAHSRICIPQETWFLIDLLARFDAETKLSSGQVEEAVSIVTSHARWKRFALDAAEVRASAKRLVEPTLKDVVALVYEPLRARAGKPRWADKTPGYISIVPELASMYPDARFIHLVRDGRDVAMSMRRLGWSPDASRWIHHGVLEWTAALDAADALTLGKDRLLEVRYEDVVTDPEGSARIICRFLDEEFEAGMVQWAEHSVSAPESRYHPKIGRQPEKGDLSRWRELGFFDALLLEAHIGERLEGRGYDLRYTGLWRAFWPAVRLAGSLWPPLMSAGAKLVRRLVGRQLPLGRPAIGKTAAPSRGPTKPLR